jgi:uncharacterized phage protein (TIGR01671 family)
MIPKFRAWYTPFGGSVKQFNKMKHGSAGSLLTHAEMSPDDYEIMQSTGLKDKNGVEIFEGDIVRVFEYGRYGGTYNAPVSWISYSNEGEQWAFHGFTCIGVKEIEHHSEVESLFTRGFLTRQFGSCVQLSELTKDPRNSIKAIGNIYENPELLEAT